MKWLRRLAFGRDVDRIVWRLDYLMAQVNRLLRMEVRQLAVLDDLKAEVEEVKTVEASAVTLLNGLAQMLRDALASGDPAAIQAVIADLDASSNALADAVAANTPAP